MNKDDPCPVYKTPAYIPKGLYFLLQRYLLIPVYCHPIYNVWEMETADVHQSING